jgi:3-mercaptopyruvate sulfurtransferase SseA
LNASRLQSQTIDELAAFLRDRQEYSAHRFFIGKATLSALQNPLIRDYVSPEKFARLYSRHGITPDTTCIFYGDA